MIPIVQVRDAMVPQWCLARNIHQPATRITPMVLAAYDNVRYCEAWNLTSSTDNVVAGVVGSKGTVSSVGDR